MGIRIRLRRDYLMRLRSQGILSGLVTYLILGAIAYYLTPPQFWDELLTFFSGRIKEISPGGTMLLTMGTLIGIVVLRIPIALVISIISKKILGKPVSNRSLFKYGDAKKYWLAVLLVLVTIEEIIGRWLFIDFLPDVFGITSTIGIWVFLIAGNALWTWMHLANFEKEKEKKLGYVITQFVGGFFYAFVFIKFGLIPCILMHFMFNAILFSGLKGQVTESNRQIKIASHLFVVGIAYLLFNQNIRDLLIWFEGKGTPAPLPGWTLLDYVTITIGISSLIGAIFTLINYDENTDTKTESVGEKILGAIIGSLLLLGMAYIANYILSGVISSIYLRMVMAYLIIMSIAKSISPNHAVKLFWIGLTSGSLWMCCVVALDWKIGGIYIIIQVVISLVANYFFKKYVPSQTIHPPDAPNLNRPWAQVSKPPFTIEK